MKSLPIAAAILISTSIAHAQSVAFVPDSLNVLPGTSFSLDIVGDDFADPILGGGFNLGFDPLVIQVSSVTFDTGTWEFDSGIDSTLSDPVASANSSGQLDGGFFGSFNAHSGGFPIATIGLQTVGRPGDAATVVMTEYEGNPFASFPSGTLLFPGAPSTLDTAQIDVVPLPAAAWMMLGGLGVLYGLGLTTGSAHRSARL